jgi:hypothetical protein
MPRCNARHQPGARPCSQRRRALRRAAELAEALHLHGRDAAARVQAERDERRAEARAAPPAHGTCRGASAQGPPRIPVHNAGPGPRRSCFDDDVAIDVVPVRPGVRVRRQRRLRAASCGTFPVPPPAVPTSLPTAAPAPGTRALQSRCGSPSSASSTRYISAACRLLVLRFVMITTPIPSDDHPHLRACVVDGARVVHQHATVVVVHVPAQAVRLEVRLREHAGGSPCRPGSAPAACASPRSWQAESSVRPLTVPPSNMQPHPLRHVPCAGKHRAGAADVVVVATCHRPSRGRPAGCVPWPRSPRAPPPLPGWWTASCPAARRCAATGSRPSSSRTPHATTSPAAIYMMLL